ncbi:MAG: hypothetical protein R2713_00570 [Ilumatobacteraceae bacterium]
MRCRVDERRHDRATAHHRARDGVAHRGAHGGAPPATTTPAGLPTTAVPPATPAPTPAPSTAPSTSMAPTTAPSTTVAVLSSLTLRPDGLGTARFGADPEQVISYVAAILGRPTEDSDWVDETTAFPECPGDEIRSCAGTTSVWCSATSHPPVRVADT